MQKIFNYVAVGVSLFAFISIFVFVFKYSEIITPTDPTNINYMFDWHAPLGAFGVLIALYIGGQTFHLVHGGLQTVQTIHGVFLTLGTLSMCIALAFIFENHKKAPLDDMYSVHAWVGIVFFVLFGVQLVVAALSFLLPILPQVFALPSNVIRAYHKAFGHALVVGGAVVVATGIFDRQRIGFDFSGAGHYDPITQWGNAAASLTLIAGFLTAFSLSLKTPRLNFDEETKPLNPDL